MIDEAQMEKSLHHLADTDDEYARAKMDLERAEILRKRTRARVFQTGEGTVAERNAAAETSEEVGVADDAYIAAIGKYEGLKASRQRAELIIEVWRSLNAARRRGNLN